MGGNEDETTEGYSMQELASVSRTTHVVKELTDSDHLNLLVVNQRSLASVQIDKQAKKDGCSGMSSANDMPTSELFLTFFSVRRIVFLLQGP